MRTFRRSFPALVIHALNNYESQKRNGSGIYYYIPKIETWQEARLVGTLLKWLEEAMGIARGTLKIKMLNERAEYALQQEVDHVGPAREPDRAERRALGLHQQPRRHVPPRSGHGHPRSNAVTMTEPSMSYYTRRNALLALSPAPCPSAAWRHRCRTRGRLNTTQRRCVTSGSTSCASGSPGS